MEHVTGVHHITAIAGKPQENLEFYTGVLGMRLVKRSINQDAPDTYHLFFADGDGNPGTDLTFFPWPRLAPRRIGSGSWSEVYLTVPPGTIDYWQNRLETAGIRIGTRERRFRELTLPFEDPHGLRLALVESRSHAGQDFAIWERSPVPAEYQIRGLGGACLVERTDGPTIRFIDQGFGFQQKEQENGITRYVVGEGAAGQRLDIQVATEQADGQWGVGGVHHVAWRVADTDLQTAVRGQISRSGSSPTEIIDRFWFRSVYAQEPGGALFEVATDGPGFAIDEDPEHLGESLVLPDWYEPHRNRIEASLETLAHEH